MDERNSEVMYRTLMEARDLHLNSLDLCERVCCVSMLCLGERFHISPMSLLTFCM